MIWKLEDTTDHDEITPLLCVENDVDEEAGVKPNTHTHRESCCDKYTSCRWVIGYLCCAARLAQSALRQAMGMAIVCMTLPRLDIEATEVTSQQPDGNTTEPVDLTTRGEFVWSSEFEGLILSSFTFGFLATPIVGGYVAGRFGGKNVIAVALTIGSIVTIVTPAASRFHPAFLVVLRAVAGIFMGTVDPAIQALWAQWAPRQEKASLTSCAYSGVSIAGMITFFISGYLCNVAVDNGWPLIFYVFGGFTLLCVIPWVMLVSDSPVDHPRITDREVEIITREQTPAQTEKKRLSTPWRKMFTSTAFWAIIIAHVSYSWVTSWVMAYLPTYMKQILRYNIEEDGVLSSMPFAGRFLSGLLCGYLSDLIRARGLLSTAKTRKLFQIIGCLGCAACTIPIGFLGHESRTLAVILLVMGLSLQNCTSVAFRINHLDIAPRFAGVMMGITVTCAMAASLSAPLITAALIKKGTREEWQVVFWIVGGLNIVGGVVFVIFAKGHELDWAREESCQIISTNGTIKQKLNIPNTETRFEDARTTGDVSKHEKTSSNGHVSKHETTSSNEITCSKL